MSHGLKLLLLLGLVSLFADVTYEGARSVVGAYMSVLGAYALAAAMLGVGEMVSYLARGAGGLLAGLARNGRGLWTLVFAGYAINLLAVPLLGLVGRWDLVLLLVFVERAGKGLRAPPRDVILAEATSKLGRGKGFGLHELLDQIGAVSGPLLMAALLAGSYRMAFLSLAVPASISLLVLYTAFRAYPEVSPPRPRVRKVSLSPLLPYTTVAALFPLGLLYWGLASYRLEHDAVLGGGAIALLFAVAMLADAFVALPSGYAYDKLGPKIFIVAPLLAAASTPLLLHSQSLSMIFVASLLWGVSVGVYETLLRAMIADAMSPELRAYAYGTVGVAFGAAWAAGSIVLGLLYQLSRPTVTLAYTLAVEAAAIAVLMVSIRSRSPQPSRC